jgi:hypothetical protein
MEMSIMVIGRMMQDTAKVYSMRIVAIVMMVTGPMTRSMVKVK